MTTTIELPIIDRRDGTQGAATCQACGGRCCQQMPGLTHPSDFGPRETLTGVLVSYLRTGFWSIDWWEGDPREGGELTQVYYVRPATVKGIGKLCDPSWGGCCALWSADHGCSLAFENRPMECRHLKPVPGDANCKGKGKEWFVRQWIPYQAEVVASMDALKALANSEGR